MNFCEHFMSTETVLVRFCSGFTGYWSLIYFTFGTDKI